jgi:hypothetical protein
MMSNAECWKRRLAALTIGTSLLSGCATVGSEPGGSSACPPIVEYGRGFQARVASELEMLPERSAIIQMMGDYAVMRDQVRACRR